MGIDIELVGLDELVNKLELMGTKTNAIIEPALKAAAAPILLEAKTTAEFIDRSGHLRDSMKISDVKNIAGSKAIWVGDVDKKANYSWYVEFGHSKAQSIKNMSAKDKEVGKLDKVTFAPPHPFLRPAFQNHIDEAKEIMKTCLAEALKL